MSQHLSPTQKAADSRLTYRSCASRQRRVLVRLGR